MFVAHYWKTHKTMLGLLMVEFGFTIGALVLFSIASPDTYRTRLWQDGADNGFNSSPIEILYSYANYKPISPPLVWSEFITRYNVVISVLSLFILLLKATMYLMHGFLPLLSVLVHALLIILYAVSAHAQSAPDMSDPTHPQPGAPWYITKSCHVVHTPNNYHYCRQAKASFAVTVCLLGLFAIYFVLAIYSSIPSQKEKLARRLDVEQPKHRIYSPESMETGESRWKNEQSQVRLHMPKTPMSAGWKNPMTPRTVAFTALEGGQGHFSLNAF
ncbi:hypothetical protein MBLNU459_g4890t1 [Dothideomycetes sp. NU459]